MPEADRFNVYIPESYGTLSVVIAAGLLVDGTLLSDRPVPLELLQRTAFSSLVVCY